MCSLCNNTNNTNLYKLKKKLINRNMPCCSCNGKRAVCKGCTCAKGNKVCINCYPGRQGKCANASIRPTASQTSSQPPLPILSLSCSSAQASQQVIPLLSTRPSPAVDGLPPAGSPLLYSQQLSANPPLSPAQLSALQPPPSSSSSPSQYLPFPGPHQPPSTSRQAFSELPCQVASPEPSVPSLPEPPSTDSPLIHNPSSSHSTRKRCLVPGCTALLAPTMWHSHMSLHARGLFPGDVPSSWLTDQNLSICTSCHQLVSNTRTVSHRSRCRSRAITPDVVLPPTNLSDTSTTSHSLPSLEEVFQLRCPTLRFVPARSRPAFARILASTLISAVNDNSEDAWLKLMMLPKCVLPSTKSKGRHLKQTPINYLCDLWSKNEFGTLWNLAKGRAIPVAHESHGNDKRQIESAVSMARAGLFGKVSRLLLSSGLAPNTDTTWQLLLSKHPSCPPPVAPLIPSTPATIGPDFNMLAILHSFPKDTAAGPSGLRIQHLLDAATIPLPTSICSALRDVVNLLASGNVPSQVSTYLAGGSLTALNKVKPGCPPDIRPIAVGETLRRLMGKCLCAVIKDKASELFHPLQFGVACSAGSEKIIHGLRKCIEDHWDDEDFVVLKVDMRNAFNLVSRQAILDECASLFPELLPWVLWCYGTHSALWHPMGRVSSESGVQQGDPLGPLLFALVLQKIISAVDVDVECIEILFNAWFLDDGVLAGPKSAVL